MASSPSRESKKQLARKKKEPPYWLFVPLIYAPTLPLVRICIRNNPVLRDRVFFGVLASAFAHEAYVMYPFATNWYSITSFINSFICFSMCNLNGYVKHENCR